MSHGEDSREIIRQLIEHARAAERLVLPGYGEFHLTQLCDAFDWAVANQPVKAGDRVVVVRLPAGIERPGHGWRPYVDVLNPEAKNPATVLNVDFYRAHGEPQGGGVWSASIRFDALPDCSFAFNVLNLRKLGEPPADGNQVNWDALAGHLDACLDSLGLAHVSSSDWLDDFRRLS